MKKRDKIKVYADTSVFGGVFDEKFAEASSLFFKQVKQGRFQLIISDVVRREMEDAPKQVRDLFEEMTTISKIADLNAPALKLRQAYLDAKILSSRWSNDALHVAIATISFCQVIVSWNFQHIVHYDKIPLYNAVNTLQGYGDIKIFSPLEVLDYEENY
jgi:hypothetical protein